MRIVRKILARETADSKMRFILNLSEAKTEIERSRERDRKRELGREYKDLFRKQLGNS